LAESEVVFPDHVHWDSITHRRWRHHEYRLLHQEDRATAPLRQSLVESLRDYFAL
jgi:hypothetical protein